MDEKLKVLAQRQAELCKVFSNEQRILITWAIDECNCTVSKIAEAIGSSLQNTSQHLNLMRDKGVLASRREGREIYYRIIEDEAVQNCQVVKSHPSLFTQKENYHD
ncbi:MAG: hypothetical protein DRI56_02200 [Chloroflexota bacterium]|nr:MAG: hypothetical protein DRI56_02200 [Chloroflexota bacterium]